jgi:DNA-binding GntR family transcriptional regulator
LQPVQRTLLRDRAYEASRSAQRHEQLIAACAAGDAEPATRLTAQIWRSSEHLAEDL